MRETHYRGERKEEKSKRKGREKKRDIHKGGGGGD